MMKKQMKESENMTIKRKAKRVSLKERGITLIALVVTTIFSYDEKLKSSNNKGFLLVTI